MTADLSHDVLSALGARIDAALTPLVAAGAPVAIVGFPNHPNVGDGAIWAGEVAWLRRHGLDVAYACDLDGYDRGALARAIGADGTILLHGGGNFGDVWPEHQRLREQVVAEFPAHRIVSLPQTMRFADPAALGRARDCFDAHDGLTLLFRDERSIGLARDAFAAPVVLCPDLALALGPLQRPADAVVDRLWLSRTDTERSGERLVPPGWGGGERAAPRVGGGLLAPGSVGSGLLAPGSAGGDVLVDWLDDTAVPMRPRLRTLRRGAARAGRAIARRPPPAPALSRAHVRVCDALATDRVGYGTALLARGEVVVTDRLHAHVLSVLLGIPHVIVDTGYGKLRTFHDAWTADVPFVRTAPDAESALEAARELAG